MEIVVYSQVPPPVHGSTLATIYLIDSLQDLGHHVRVIDRRFSKRVDEVGRPTLQKALRVPSLLTRAAISRFKKSDVSICFTTTAKFSFLVDLLVVPILKARRSKCIFFVHTVGYERLSARSFIWRMFVQLLLSQPDVIVCLSNQVAADLHTKGKRASIRIIPNMVKSMQAPPTSDGRSTFIFFANLIPEKGALEFVKIARRAFESGIRANFEVYGSTADADHLIAIKREIADLPNIKVLGQVVDENEKARILSGATALLYPTRYPMEAQPLAIIEAMSAGTPTISYRAGGIAELIEDRKTGILCDNVEEMWVHTKALVLNPVSARRLGHEALAQYERNHSKHVYRERWRSLLDEMNYARVERNPA